MVVTPPRFSGVRQKCLDWFVTEQSGLEFWPFEEADVLSIFLSSKKLFINRRVKYFFDSKGEFVVDWLLNFTFRFVSIASLNKVTEKILQYF